MTEVATRPAPPPVPEIPPFRLRYSMNGIAEAPGKVWFFELAAAVIDADRCIRCGTCVAACPTDSIGVGRDDLPVLVKMCTGCSLCWDFCPRGGLRYEATWPVEPAQFGAGDDEPAAAWRITGEGAPGAEALEDPAPGLGTLLSLHGARLRPGSRFSTAGVQDGGVVSALLLAALEAGEIDGALVAREDPETPWRGVPFVATTPEEIAACGGSFYNQTMALAALDLERVGLGPNARIAVVGTPCEIQGVRALQARSWRRGASRVDAITLTVALLCTKSFDYRRLMLEAIRDERNVDLADVSKVDVIHGRLVVLDRSGATIVDEAVKRFHGAALKGCDECADFLGRGADLSVGSVGTPDGFSSVLVRSEAGARAFSRIAAETELAEVRLEALERLDRLDKKIAFGALERPFDPTGPLFVDFDEHVAFYDASDRAPVWRGR